MLLVPCSKITAKNLEQFTETRLFSSSNKDIDTYGFPASNSVQHGGYTLELTSENLKEVKEMKVGFRGPNDQSLRLQEIITL